MELDTANLESSKQTTGEPKMKNCHFKGCKSGQPGKVKIKWGATKITVCDSHKNANPPKK